MKGVIFIAVLWLGVVLAIAVAAGLRLLGWRIARPQSYFLHHAARRSGASGSKCIKRLYARFGKKQGTDLLLTWVSSRLVELDTRGLIGTTEGFHRRLHEFATLMRNSCAALRDLDLDREVFPLLRDRIYPAYLRQPQRLEKKTAVVEQEPGATVGAIVSERVETVENPALGTFAAIIKDL